MQVKIIYLYAHEDEALLSKLKSHLKPLKHQEVIDWYDRDINAGSEWAQEIDRHINEAQIILLLVSPDFIASEYCYGIEVKRAMERHEQGKAIVIPVILRPCDWQIAPFARLPVIPENMKPITLWRNRDQAFDKVVTEIYKVVNSFVGKAVPDKGEEKLNENLQKLTRKTVSEKSAQPKLNESVGGQKASAINTQLPASLESTSTDLLSHKVPKINVIFLLASGIAGIILYIIGDAISPFIQLSSPILILLRAIGSIITVVVAIVAILTFLATRPELWNWFDHHWRALRPFFRHIISVSVAIVLIIVLFLLGGVFYGHITSIQSSSSHSSTSGTALPTPPSLRWNYVFHQTVPFCENSSGAKWAYDSNITYLACRNSGLAMQLTIGDPRIPFSQLELSNINGNTYDQSTFLMRVKVSFQNPSDQNTVVILHIQEQRGPNDIEAHEGYGFLLAPTGYWRFSQFVSGASNEPARDGNINFDPTQPIIITIVVQNHLLYALINNEVVLSKIPNNGPSKGIVSLSVGNSQGYSSLVIFSDFELDTLE